MIRNTRLRAAVWVLAAFVALAPSYALAQLAGGLQFPGPGLTVAVSGVLDCTGGSVTTSGVNRIHTFNSGSNLVCTGLGTVTYLVVGGGGGGCTVDSGVNQGAGGGGAGQVATGSTGLATGTYAITVGGGGAGCLAGTYNAVATSGQSSVFSSVTAVGGGGGAPGSSLGTGVNGANGASGGGGGGGVTPTNGGTATAGNNGGNGASNSGGGGGGASAVGTAGSVGVAGVGGAGTASNISGGSVTYGGGGGGAGNSAGGGGAGGGGAGYVTTASAGSGVAGTANTGGGGGASKNNAGAAGGSGVVIVSYPSPRAPISLGTASAAGSATSVAMTGGVNIVAGDLVVVSVGHLTASGTTVTSVSDGTNTYTLATSGTDSTTQEAELWYKINASAVTNPTITANLSGSAASRVIGAVRVAGGLTTLDVAPAGVGTTASTTPTVSTGTLATSKAEIVIGFLYVASAPTVTEGSGFTQVYNENAASVTNHLAFQVTTATTTVAYSPTNSVASNNVIMVAVFR